MAKKLQKVRKPMSPKTKATIVNGFKGVISNQACIDNAKEGPWWLAIIWLLISIIIPLIPNHVRMANAYGSSFLSGGAYGLDRGLAKASIRLSHEGRDFVVGDDSHLHYYDTVANKDISDEYLDSDKSYTPLYSDIITTEYTYKDGEDTKTESKPRVNFTIHYTKLGGGDLQALINRLDQKKLLRGTIDTVYDPENQKHVKIGCYTPNFLVLSYDTLACAIYQANTDHRVSTTFGGLNYTKMPRGKMLEAALKYYVDKSILIPVDEQEVLKDNEAVKSIYNYYKGVFDNTYLDQKNVTKWNTTLIYLGVYAGLMLFLGLMIFLLTRGKNNPFRTYNFWVCQKIAYTLGFTPALLAMVLGFIIGANMIGQMAFIMLLSLRVMWASMRQLRPM